MYKKQPLPVAHRRAAPSWPTWLGCLGLAACLAVPMQASAAAREASSILAVGILAHDQGPMSDHHEHGVDLNLELLFTPVNLFGTPRPHLGASLNLAGDTNVAYAGLTFPFYESRRWFLNGALSAALHDGPLHKDPVGCQLYSDCGFGVRVLPRAGLSYGYYLSSGEAIALFWDHMSHKWVINGENEGIDHIGLRYQKPF